MHVGGGAFGKFVAWHHYSKCNDKMLSNDKCLETRIQRLFDGLIFVKRGLGVHLQRMLEISSIYRVFVHWRNFFSKMFGKIVGTLGTLFTIMI